ncbi:MAG: alkaline phosphatase family protein [Janthinobacterium lividum]
MRKTVVLNVVGLTPSLLGHATPALSAFAARGKLAAIEAVTPAVTCTAQATYFTGVLPRQHGIVGNGWYFAEECEVKFWRQSNKLVEAPKIWEIAKQRDPGFTCANYFNWYNMYSSVEYSVTPRPMYPADGRKLPDIYTQPAELRDELQRELGTFPLFDFWGPRTSIRSTEWIAKSALQTDARHNPTLSLIYLPHLDYDLQRLGPDHPEIARSLREVDRVCGELIRYYEARKARVLVLSEYGITAVRRPVHLNRVLREHGLIAVREELGRELLDAGASKAFAVADHQVAHVYVNDPARLEEVRRLILGVPGVERVLDAEVKAEVGLDHARSGDLVVVAEADAWFTYYYWLDDRKAPDFARTVDIHRKPGYDPVELFLDPSMRFPKVKVGLKLLKKKLGFRYLMDVIPLDAGLVRGSHGRPTTEAANGPLLVTNEPALLGAETIAATDVANIILEHLDLG